MITYRKQIFIAFLVSLTIAVIVGKMYGETKYYVFGISGESYSEVPYSVYSYYTNPNFKKKK